MPISYYIRPDELWSLNGGVGDIAGATDSDYTNEWLVDGRPGRPVKSTNGTVTWGITNPVGYVDVIVLSGRIDAGRSITIGGSVVTSMTAPALRPNSIARSFVTSVTPAATCGSLTVSVTSNSNAVVLKVYAGKLRSFARAGLLNDDLSNELTNYSERLNRFGVTFDPGVAGRVFQATTRGSTSQMDDLEAWYEAQQNDFKPSIVISDLTLGDVRVANLRAPKIVRDGLLWHAALTFEEFPRVRW